MSPSIPIIAQSLESLGQGVYLLIGILVFGFFAGIVALVIYVAIRAWIFQVRQRRSQEAYLKRTRRADGKNYPPRGGGICQQCGRVRKFVFFLPTGEMFCPECYEAWWPIAEGTVDKGGGLHSTPHTPDRAGLEQPRRALWSDLPVKKGDSRPPGARTL
jgi:hypothetical protein